MKHLLTIGDVSREEILRIFALTEDLKRKFVDGLREPILPGRVLALLFEKPSLRTRVSFEAGIAHLGGSSMMLGEDAGFGKRESVADFTRVLSEMVDVIVMRAKSHATVEAVARYSNCSVINGLTDFAHPCQALADLFTLGEQVGSLDGAKLAWVGDANNVARSVAQGCGLLGVKFAIASPRAYGFDKAQIAQLRSVAPELDILVTQDPYEAVADATAVYTDVWASMGQENEQHERAKAFARYQVDEKLMLAAGDAARFMHCLPARRGEEVTDAVIDGSYSIVVEQAANRVHVQKGILAWLLGANG